MFLLLTTLLLPAEAALTGTYTLSKKTERVTFESVEGEITVRVSDDVDRVTYTVLDHRPGRVCEIVTVATKNRVTVSFGPKWMEDPKECRADLEIVLPVDMPIAVALVQGAVDVTGVEAPLRIEVGTGSVRLTDVDEAAVRVDVGEVQVAGVTGSLGVEIGTGRLFGEVSGEVDAKIGEGEIALGGLTDAVMAKTSIGNILLDFVEVPGGDLYLNAVRGNVVVDLPEDAVVRPRLSASGTATCELEVGEGIEVVAVAGRGSVRLH